MTVYCTKCDEALPCDFAICKGPKGCQLHFGLCSGIQESTWRRGDKSDWRCPECRKIKPTDDQPAVTSEELRDFMKYIKGQLEPVERLHKLVVDLKESVEFVSKKYDDLNEKVKKTEEAQNSTEETIKLLKTEIMKKDATIGELNARMRETEQYSRNRNIEVSGLEVKKGEDLVKIMDNIAQKIGIPFNYEDIDVIHRVPSRRSDKPPRVIAQFTTRKKRNEFLKNKNSDGIVLSKDVVDGGTSDTRIYLSAHLTPEWKRLLWQTKQVGKPKGYKIIWFQDNRILMKKDVTDTHPIYITNEGDLAKLQ